MAIRLIVTINAALGKGSELAQAYKARCAEVMKEPGCESSKFFRAWCIRTNSRFWNGGRMRKL